MIELRTLGSLDLRRSDGEAVAAILSQPKRAALLVYLTLAGRSGPVRRDSLLALFWPEQDSEHARGALRQALSVLRRSVEEEAFVSRGAEEVGINPTCVRCDAAAFERALDAGELERALNLYSGDLLPGFFVSEAPAFERWLDGERERLRARAAQAAWSLAERAAAGGMGAGVKTWGNRALELAPDDETLLQQAVVLLDRIGDRAGALRAYDRFADRMRQDFDAEPAPETNRLIDVVRKRLHAHGNQVLQLASPVSGRDRATIVAGAYGVRGRVMALVVGGALLLAWGPQADHSPPAAAYAATAAAPTIIAVLPFEPLAADSATAFFAEGLTEDLVTRLSQIASLRVVSRSAVERYRESQVSLRDLAEKLGASWLVLGKVRQSGNRIRITVHMLDAGRDEYAWSAQYDESVQDVLMAQARAALSIAEALEVKLSSEERTDIQARPQDNLAWTYTEQARLLANRGLAAAAHGLARKAIAVDPQYSTAWAVLAHAFLKRSQLGEDLLDSAEAAAATAISLNPQDSRAYVVRALLRWNTDNIDIIGVLADRLKALELNPSYAFAVPGIRSVLHNMGLYDRAAFWLEYYGGLDPDTVLLEYYWGDLHWKLGAYEVAERELRLATLLDPANLGARLRLAEVLATVGRYEDARTEIEIGRSVAPENPTLLAVAGLIQILSHDYSGAQDNFLQLLRHQPPFLEASASGILTKTALGFTYWKTGDTVRARQMLEQSLQDDLLALRDSTNFWVSFHRYQDIARIHAIRGNRDEAMRWLTRAYDKHRWQYVYTLLGPQDPTLENLRGDPRFERLVAQARARIDSQRVRVEALRPPLTRADFERIMDQARRDVERWRGKPWWEWR